MCDVRIALGLAACLTAVATGCTTATTAPGQVQEGDLGTYRIGISRTTGLAQGDKATNDAIDKAGDFCHAKGQKVMIVPNPGSSVITFRCGAPM